MRYLILVSSLMIILCVSCASSRQEFTTQQLSTTSSLKVGSASRYMEELLARLAARFADSVHFVVENYYPPVADSDSVGPLMTKITYQHQTKVDVESEAKKDIQIRDSVNVQQNDSINNVKNTEIRKESSSFRFSIVHLFVCLVIFFVLYGWLKKAF